MARVYKIEVRETLSRVVEVTAETEYEAILQLKICIARVRLFLQLMTLLK